MCHIIYAKQMNETLKFNALLKMPKLLKEISFEAEISHHGARSGLI